MMFNFFRNEKSIITNHLQELRQEMTIYKTESSYLFEFTFMTLEDDGVMDEEEHRNLKELIEAHIKEGNKIIHFLSKKKIANKVKTEALEKIKELHRNYIKSIKSENEFITSLIKSYRTKKQEDIKEMEKQKEITKVSWKETMKLENEIIKIYIASGK